MNKKLKREVIEWAILLAVGGGLYFSGYHKDVLGLLQRGILATRLFTPDVEENAKQANYQFDLVDENGATVPMETFKGQTVFLNIWATWCPPCIAEMPDINELYQALGEEVTFLIISVDDNPDKAIAFRNRKQFDFPVYFAKNGFPQVFHSRSIPTTYVISPDGSIVVDQKGMSKYNTEGFRSFLLSLNSN
ncbi:MAG: TlpA family protein disulfide reductase [Cyclobacteriaceae bacterium]